MTTPEVSIRKNGPEDPPLPPQPPPPQPPPVVEKCVVLQWREVTLGHDQLKEILRSKQVSGVMEVCPFWGHLDDDDRTIKLLADTPGEVDIVAVIPARNTPMKAHIRIINDIRKAVGRDRPIAIMLWNVDVQGQPISANEKQLVMWRNKLNPLPDAYLSIHSLT